MPERNAIHFRNAPTPAKREAAGLLHKRTSPQRHDAGHREALSEWATIRAGPIRQARFQLGRDKVNSREWLPERG